MYQKELSNFVSNNVVGCQTMLVDKLLEEGMSVYDDIINYYAPITEEEIQERINEQKDQDEESGEHKNATEEDYRKWSVEELKANREPQKIFEWWLCDDWLIDKLKEKGEPILRNDYGDWWGRTCTGQAVFLDGVIERIYDDNVL